MAMVVVMVCASRRRGADAHCTVSSTSADLPVPWHQPQGLEPMLAELGPTSALQPEPGQLAEAIAVSGECLLSTNTFSSTTTPRECTVARLCQAAMCTCVGGALLYSNPASLRQVTRPQTF